MPTTRPGLRLGLLLPSLEPTDGVRRTLDLANRLVARGHQVTGYVDDDQGLDCAWMACSAQVKTWSSGFDDLLDVLVFSHERLWHLLERFAGADRRIFYALRLGRAVQAAGSWNSARAAVDLQLAASPWIADQLAAEIDHRPLVLPDGVDRQAFRPYGGPKRRRLLALVEDGQAGPASGSWAAGAQAAGTPLEQVHPGARSATELGRLYDSAEIVLADGTGGQFGQPGLEAMSCGVPLIVSGLGATDHYAIDGQTAVVVPAGDADALARAVADLQGDPDRRSGLAGAGLDLVADQFDAEARTDELVEVLDGVVAGVACAPPPPPPAPPVAPDLSVVVLAWDNLGYTADFVESVRRHTDVDYELIIVDNGSQWVAADFARAAADVAVLNDTNRGFSPGMNQGLAAATGRHVAFCNNDTVMPPAWASRLVETADANPGAGIVVPALTAAGTPTTVRTEPGVDLEVIPPFSGPPPAVIYLMPRAVAEGLEGWGEEYLVASGEDVDLGFKVWVNDLDILYDQRVLVDHVGKASASKLDDWQARWAANRALFLEKWSGPEAVPRLATCDERTFARNRATASSVAEWMAKYFRARDKAAAANQALEASKGSARPPTPDPAPAATSGSTPVPGFDPTGAAAAADPAESADPANPANPIEPTAPTRLVELRTSAWTTTKRQTQRNVRRVRRRTPEPVRRSIRVVLVRLPDPVQHTLRKTVRRP